MKNEELVRRLQLFLDEVHEERDRLARRARPRKRDEAALLNEATAIVMKRRKAAHTVKAVERSTTS